MPAVMPVALSRRGWVANEVSAGGERMRWYMMPAVLVAIVFRALDALRVFDIVYVLTPNNPNTATMSVFARENLFDFDQFAYGSAASTLLFLIIALLTIGFIRATRMNLGGER